MKKRISIITVAYENYSVLEGFISCLKKQESQNFYLIIADLSENKQNINIGNLEATVLHLENKGYAYGVNEGIKKSLSLSIDNFCIINDDVEFENNFTKQLEVAFENHKNSAFGGKIYYAKGFEFHKDKYKDSELGEVIWYAGGEVDWKNAWTKHIGVDEVDDKEKFETTKETDFITGCLFCFNKKIFEKVGFWDEKYFLYYEDADYSERLKKANIPLFYDPKVKIWHKNAQSSGGSGSSLHQKLQKKSHLRFSLKFAPFRTKLHVLKNYFLKLK
jgi:GT2 family glycosyltransferase